MVIVWTRAARRDFAAHFDYLAPRSLDAALRMEEAVLQAIDGLTKFPHRGRPGRRDGTRELIIRGHPYIVVYSVGTTRIAIVRVLHTAQEWPPAGANRP
jgi:plasmid stabilization system protein ParE